MLVKYCSYVGGGRKREEGREGRGGDGGMRRKEVPTGKIITHSRWYMCTHYDEWKEALEADDTLSKEFKEHISKNWWPGQKHVDACITWEIAREKAGRARQKRGKENCIMQ
jgi:hypothetical protein